MVILVSSFWCITVVLPSFLVEGNSLQQKMAGFTTLLFAPICHQNPGRSFFINGYQMVVCTRCAGLYFGFFSGLLAYPFFMDLKNVRFPSRWFLAIILSLSVLEYLISKTSLVYPRVYTRAATGLISGSVIAFFVLPALMDLSNMCTQKMRKRLWNKLPAS